jgi:DNA-binding beta-propeller fold protein YncE
MRNARRTRFWHPVGPAAGIGALLVFAAANPGCSCGDDTNPAQTSSTTTSGGGTGGTGGSGGSGPLALESCHNDGATFQSPLDATPDATGETVYFTALTIDGDPGVFGAACNGPITTLAAGDPLAAPFNIALSIGGTAVYVADPGAEGPMDEKGMIFRIPTAGGAPAPIAGTEGTQPHGLDVMADVDGAETLWFTGVDPSDGAPALLTIPADGGTVTVVAKGAPFSDPSGVALKVDGTAYVADTDGGADRLATIIEVAQGNATVIASGIEVGYPAGVALTLDEMSLVVSGYNRDKETDAVIFVDLATQAVSSLEAGIDTFNESAGLHRARNAEVFAWADSRAQGSGTVFIFH